MKKISISTDRGTMTAHLLGERGDWVVCWPGQLHDTESLIDFARLLARDFRVVICDAPAIASNRNLPYSCSVPNLLYYAQRLLLKLGIERCHWVGQSAGGVVGAALHGLLPEQLLSLTLASAPMLGQGRFRLPITASTALLSRSRLGRAILASRGIKEMGFADRQEKSTVLRYLRDVMERTSPQTIANMRPLDGVSVRLVFDKLRSAPPPMLVLCGRYDQIVLHRDQRTVAEITQSQFVELKCGHLPLMVEPEKCAHAFRRFVQALPHRNAWCDTVRLPLAA